MLTSRARPRRYGCQSMLLSSLRKGAATWVAKLLFVILIASFGAWGVGDFLRGGKQAPLAEIGDAQISAQQFSQEFNRELNRLRQAFGGQIDRDMAIQLGLPRQVLSQMVSREVQRQEAARLGIAYGYDGLRHLVSLVGPSWARLIMYTGMRIDSAEALRIGLVDRVLPDGELWSATMDVARTISGNAPLAIQAAKITIREVLKDESKRDMEAIKAIGNACMDSEDFREGRTAFMEKRKPQFKGR